MRKEEDDDWEFGSHMLDRAIPMLIRMTTTPGNIHFFANLFKVSPRTIQREIQMLRNKGFPIVIDRETGVVQVVSDYGIPPVGFTLGEAVAMVVLFEEYGEHIKEPVFSSIRTACYKLISSLPADTLTQMSGIQNCLTVLPRNTQVENDDEKTFDRILKSMISGQAVEIDYSSPSIPGIIRTRLHPYSVMFGRGWYVVGYSGLYRQVRTFKVSRVSDIRFLEEKFEIPSKFSLDEYLGNAWYLIPDSGPDQEVVVRFSARVARNVAEVKWHKTQEMRELPNGRIELRFQVSGLEEIQWWILGYGEEVEVVEPPKLRKMIAEHVRKMLHMYTNE